MDEDEMISNAIQNSEKEEKLTIEQIEEKRKKIKKEKDKLDKIFKKMDKNRYDLVKNLIIEVAFMSITLEENREYIEEHGVKEFYMNGKGQFGFKESVESKNYNAMFKNYSNAIKQLVDFLPTEEKKNSGEDLLRFIASGKK
jgi:hypothetical protein